MVHGSERRGELAQHVVGGERNLRVLGAERRRRTRAAAASSNPCREADRERPRA